MARRQRRMGRGSPLAIGCPTLHLHWMGVEAAIEMGSIAKFGKNRQREKITQDEATPRPFISRCSVESASNVPPP
eukprot:8444445-Pyramimonas_sp.AAC.1